MFSSNEEEQKLELKKFIEDDPKWRLEQIILNEKVRETVLDVITFCKNKDRLIEEWGLNNFLKGNSSIGINLYGEPGTGKSITAEAISHGSWENAQPTVRTQMLQMKSSRIY